MTAVWHLRSRAIDEVVRADDQFGAWETLRDRPLDDFGLIVTAEPNEQGESARIGVHTSALMTWWGREDDAGRFRALAVENGLPDTIESDRAFAESRDADSQKEPSDA